MTYKVQLDTFEGPLDLLIYLIRKNEIDIKDIPIVLITQQYLEYLDIMKALNLDIAGDFLVMASTLMYIKSRSLLPKQEDEIAEEAGDPLEELRRQLLEHQKFQDAALRLKEKVILGKDVFTRSLFEDEEGREDKIPLEEVSLFDLLSALKNVLDKGNYKDALMEVTIEQISVKDKITEIMDRMRKEKRITFQALFLDLSTKLEVINAFLALLELIKLQVIKAFQYSSVSPIYLVGIEGMGDVEEIIASY
jgi:segregation and condensation protein A